MRDFIGAALIYLGGAVMVLSLLTLLFLLFWNLGSMAIGNSATAPVPEYEVQMLTCGILGLAGGGFVLGIGYLVDG